MINVFLYDAKKNSDYDENLFPQSLIYYLKNNKKSQISYIAYNLLLYILKEICKIEDIDFDFSNKPKLISEEVNFNISHSGDYIAIGVSFENKVGIDIESTKREISSTLFERALNEHEKMLQPEIYDKNTYFLRCHVKKEAYLKYVGTGFNVHPKNINSYLLDYYPIYSFEEQNLILCVAGERTDNVNIFNLM